MSDSSLAEDNELIKEEDVEPQYGICQTIRDTTVYYWDSYSLSPDQIMEQEVYYCSAYTALDALFLLLQFIEGWIP
jgi:hypothetical protein